MQIINNKESLSEILKEYKSIGNKISLIPTMGNLHRGHQELFSSAPDRTIKITTIYINPLQFNNSDDYDSYPRTLNHDLEMYTVDKYMELPKGGIDLHGFAQAFPT